ncbi:transcriptional regulator, partial [Streptomyces rimosus]
YYWLLPEMTDRLAGILTRPAGQPMPPLPESTEPAGAAS